FLDFRCVRIKTDVVVVQNVRRKWGSFSPSILLEGPEEFPGRWSLTHCDLTVKAGPPQRRIQPHAKIRSLRRRSREKSTVFHEQDRTNLKIGGKEATRIRRFAKRCYIHHRNNTSPYTGWAIKL